MVTFQRYQKTHPFPDLIHGIWRLITNQSEMSLHLIPDGYPELFFPINGSFTLSLGDQVFQIKEPTVIGLFNKSCNLHITSDSSMISIKLMPWALPSFIRDDAKLMLNEVVKLDCFYKKEEVPLPIDLSTELKFNDYVEQQLFSFINKIIDPKKSSTPFLSFHVKNMFEEVHNLTQAKQENNLRYSKRYVEKLYQQYVGMSPLKYAQSIKIKKACLLLSNRKTESLHALSMDLGYYDQSHFYKDFLKIVKLSPTKFIQSLPQRPLLNNQNYKKQYDYY